MAIGYPRPLFYAILFASTARALTRFFVVAEEGWRFTALVECWVMKYRVYLEPDEDGIFVATCPALPRCISQGRTRAEAAGNIREAIEGYLKSLRKHGERLH